MIPFDHTSVVPLHEGVLVPLDGSCKIRDVALAQG